MKDLHVRLELKWQDLWVGVFWRTDDLLGDRYLNVWICLIPCLPLHLSCNWELP